MQKPTAEQMAAERLDFQNRKDNRASAYKTGCTKTMKRNPAHSGPPKATSWDDTRRV
jgi:hypothetical protein